jgi:hypothetical protein
MNADTPATDKPRASRPRRINGPLSEQTEQNIRTFADKSMPEISERIRRLEVEWDLERSLAMTAGTLALTGAALGTRKRGWLLMSGVATGFLLWHALKGWSPPVPLLRKAGVRTREEINRELYALKALRGDFEKVRQRGNGPGTRASKALEAVAPEPESVSPSSSEDEMPPHQGAAPPGEDVPPVTGGI